MAARYVNEMYVLLKRRAKQILSLAGLLAGALLVSCSAIGQEFHLTDQQFDQWVTNGQSSIEDATRAHVALQVSYLGRLFPLTEEQKENLQLAGRGDLSRFEAKVALLRDELVDKTYDQQEISDVFMEIQPLQQQYRAGLLGEGSLFRKVLAGTLSSEQWSVYRKDDVERRSFRYGAAINVYIAVLQRRTAMTSEQRAALIRLLAEHSRPPKKFGDNDVQYVMYQASQLPEGEVKKIFDRAQMTVLQAALAQGKAYRGILEAQGVLEDEEIEVQQPNP